MMGDSKRRAFFHLIDALTAQKEAAYRVDLAIGWGQSGGAAKASSIDGLVRIQRDLDKAMADIAREIADFK